MKELPRTIQQYLHLHFPAGHIFDSREIRVKDQLHYLVQVETDGERCRLEFDHHGNLLRRSEQKLYDPEFDTEYTYEDFFDD